MALPIDFVASFSVTCAVLSLQKDDWVAVLRWPCRVPLHLRFYLFWSLFLPVIQLVELLILANFDYFSAFIPFDKTLKIPNCPSRIVCNSPRWNGSGNSG